MHSTTWAHHTECIDGHVHVWPQNDLVEHLTEGPGADDGECICGPEVRPVNADSGRINWVLTHHSLDGRELKEE